MHKKEFARKLSARERCLQGRIHLRELRILFLYNRKFRGISYLYEKCGKRIVRPSAAFIFKRIFSKTSLYSFLILSTASTVFS